MSDDRPSATPGVRATTTQSVASPEGNDGESHRCHCMHDGVFSYVCCETEDGCCCSALARLDSGVAE